MLFQAYRFGDNVTEKDWAVVFEGVAGFGLGSATVALFSRVGGGIYTKAADVGAELVAQGNYGLVDNDPRNPACIADIVGDNVGNIAGMGADLFGSLAEALCACLLIASTSKELTSTGGYLYPFLIVASGIIVCMISAYVAFRITSQIKNYIDLEWTIKLQLVLSTIMLIPTVGFITIYYMPQTYSLGEKGSVLYLENITRNATMICSLLGLVSGLCIAISTEYFTNLSYRPVTELTDGCKQGPAINIILGLAVGYLSNIIPTLFIAITLFGSYLTGGMFGLSLGALGMLSNLPISLAMDGYGPIADNASKLSAVCNLDPIVKERTNNLDAAGNTTSAVGKGYANGAACLCAFALFGAFIIKANIKSINVMTPLVMSGLLFGAMIPYLFAALTMKAVGTAAEKIAETVADEYEINKEHSEPNTGKCIALATEIALRHTILPGLIVVLVPFGYGVLFGAEGVCGVVIGIIISGVQLAICSSNSGGAWDNCKKRVVSRGVEFKGLERVYNIRKDCTYNLNKLKANNEDNTHDAKIKELEDRIEECNDNIRGMEMFIRVKGKMPAEHEAYTAFRTLATDIEGRKQEEEDKRIITEFYRSEVLISSDRQSYKVAETAANIADTVGDPLKDTTGPSLNVLIKLSTIISLIFGHFFVNTGFFTKAFAI